MKLIALTLILAALVGAWTNPGTPLFSGGESVTFAADTTGTARWLITDELGRLLVVTAGGALPTGAATEATLATLALESGGNLDSLSGCVDGSEMQVDVISSALPAGAATEVTLATLALESGGVLDDILTALTLDDDHTFAQITGVEYSSSHDVSSNLYHTVVLDVVGDTDIDLVVQWSIDGTTWFDEYAVNNAITGVYESHWEAKVKYVRVGAIDEHGTGSTIDAVYYGGR